MREISLDESTDELPTFTVLNYGDTKSGKTTWASTWPRVLVLADVVERGYESVRSADRATWFEPDWAPTIIGLESLADLVQLAAPGGRIDQLIAQGKVRTIVFDALSYFVELMLNTIIQLQTKPDTRSAYGDLGKQLRNVRNIVQSKPVSVLWNCIVKHPTEDDPRGRPLIAGAQGEAWPGACDFVFNSKVVRKREAVDTEIDDEANPGQTKIVKRQQIIEQFLIHTRQNGPYIGGHRLGVRADLLPDPFTGTYTDFVQCLGYDVDKLREAIKKPPKLRAPSVAAPVAAAKSPPVTIRSVPPKVVAAPSQANPTKR